MRVKDFDQENKYPFKVKARNSGRPAVVVYDSTVDTDAQYYKIFCKRIVRKEQNDGEITLWIDL